MKKWINLHDCGNLFPFCVVLCESTTSPHPAQTGVGLSKGDVSTGYGGVQSFAGYFACQPYVLAPISGCFGENEPEIISENDVVVTPAILSGGVFQGVTISADKDMSAFIPYLIQNEETGFVQNSTVVDLSAGDSVLLQILAPPEPILQLFLLGNTGVKTGRCERLTNHGGRGTLEMVLQWMTTLVFQELLASMKVLTQLPSPILAVGQLPPLPFQFNGKWQLRMLKQMGETFDGTR